jgi:hypothetical protein
MISADDAVAAGIVAWKRLNEHGRTCWDDWLTVARAQDAIRRAATALRECRSNDTFTLARIALEAALRSESDLVDLLPPEAAAMSALTRRTDVVGGTGYVR